MSIQHCLLPLLLLCLSVHACNSRLLARHSVKHVHVSDKVVEKVIHPSTSNPSLVKSSMSKEIIVDYAHEAGATAKRTRQKPKAVAKKVEQVVQKMKNTRAARGDQSLSTVSFHIPHPKHDEHPGFSLDYSPPKTHPPHHN